MSPDEAAWRKLNRLLAQGRVTAMPADRPCKGCGGCCGGVLPLRAGELEQLRALAAEMGVKRRRDGLCPFLTKRRECAAYGSRPMICRLYDCRKHADGEMGNPAVAVLTLGSEPVDLNRELFRS